jgi:hypothetical protein
MVHVLLILYNTLLRRYSSVNDLTLISYVWLAYIQYTNTGRIKIVKPFKLSITYCRPYLWHVDPSSNWYACQCVEELVSCILMYAYQFDEGLLKHEFESSLFFYKLCRISINAKWMKFQCAVLNQLAILFFPLYRYRRTSTVVLEQHVIITYVCMTKKIIFCCLHQSTTESILSTREFILVNEAIPTYAFVQLCMSTNI